MLADYHVHSHFSDDSVYDMKDVIKDAVTLGLDEICFCDHVDYGVKEYHGPIEKKCVIYNVNYPLYFKTLEQLSLKYQKDITIKKGLEFGIQTHTISDYEQLFKSCPLDFVLLSIHQIEDKEFHTGDFMKGRSQKEYNELYYRELYNIVTKYHNYSVLAHLDLLNRYDPLGVYPFEKIEDQIAEILKVVIKDDKGIEFNTSYHRYGLKDTTPSLKVLKLYKDLGGKIITIGSDSHKKEHLGAYIKESQVLLKSLGYETFCIYDKMIPSFRSLAD